MRRLLPTYAESIDLDDAYAYPDGVPWLRANMVASVDGAIALDGRSGGLSGPADKRVFRVLRNLADVVLVGAGTARAEGYAGVLPSEARVAWRRARGLTDVPAIAVVTRTLDLDPASGLFHGTTVPTIVVTTEAAAEARGSLYDGVAELVTTPGDAVDVGSAVDALVGKGFRRLLCEGGPSLLGHVAAAGRLDELCLTISPLLVSGAGKRLVEGGQLGPLRLGLDQLLEEEGSLFARYSAR
jgi:riboflavin biosynthesis pyrimidine reductase